MIQWMLAIRSLVPLPLLPKLSLKDFEHYLPSMWKWKLLSRIWLFVTSWNSPWNSPSQNTGVGSLSLLQGIFPIQGSNPGLPHGKQILYQLSHKKKYRKDESEPLVVEKEIRILDREEVLPCSEGWWTDCQGVYWGVGDGENRQVTWPCFPVEQPV